MRLRQRSAEISVEAPNEKINKYKHTQNIQYHSEREGKERGNGEWQIVVEERPETDQYKKDNNDYLPGMPEAG